MKRSSPSSACRRGAASPRRSVGSRSSSRSRSAPTRSTRASSAEKRSRKHERAAAKNLAVALENLALARQGQVSERFSRAVEQLGETDGNGRPARDVRTGALFSVMRIGIDSELYTQPALLIVATYVRTHFAPPAKLAPNGCKAHFGFIKNNPMSQTRLASCSIRSPRGSARRTKGREGQEGLARSQGRQPDGPRSRRAEYFRLRPHGDEVQSRLVGTREAPLRKTQPGEFRGRLPHRRGLHRSVRGRSKIHGCHVDRRGWSGRELLSKAQRAQLRTAP